LPDKTFEWLRDMLVEENLNISVENNTGWDPRVKSIKCGELVRSYLIKTERFLLVYDTLLGPKSGAFLREQALIFADSRPLLIVNSHADWDHYFGNMMFPEPILGTQAMVKRVTEGVGDKELASKRAEHPACYEPVRLVAPSVAVPRETVLHGGDLTIRLLLTKGHRPDHLALFVPEIATLFPGDCVEDPIPLVDEDSDETSHTLEELGRSLESFLELQPDWVLANHAEPEKGVDRIESNLAYLKKLEASALAAESLDSLKKDLPAEPTWDGFYRKAHMAHLRMARQQIRGRTRTKWADD
jgi:glyoxylase-like metal-dependent hydrolase (beta-lactamase superfamily II)